MCMVLVISAVGLNSGNLILTRNLPWVEKFPAAVENIVPFVMGFFRCLRADWLTSAELAPELMSVLRKKYSHIFLA